MNVEIKHRRPAKIERRWRNINLPLELYLDVARRAALEGISASFYLERVIRRDFEVQDAPKR